MGRKGLHSEAYKKQLRKAEKAKSESTSSALHRGVAGVAVASTLAMMLPTVSAAALQANKHDETPEAHIVSSAGKNNAQSKELNMLRWGAGVRNQSAQTKRLVQIARKDIEAKKLEYAKQSKLANLYKNDEHVENLDQDDNSTDLDNNRVLNSVRSAENQALKARAIENQRAANNTSENHSEDKEDNKQASAQPTTEQNSSVKPENGENAQPESTSDATADNTTEPSANNAPASSAPISASTGSNADAGSTARPSADGNGNTQGQGTQGQSAENPTTQGSNASGSSENTNSSSENTNAAPSAPAPAPAPASTSNAGTPSTGTPSTGTPNAGATNTATDPNSQVIKPNEQNPTADDQQTANEQVQTDKKPEVTYNLQIRYTIGGAANKQLVQPYELTIDKDDFDNLGKNGKYDYIKLPKSAGYRPSVYHSGTYKYYIINSEGKYVIDDGTDADAVRYLRIDKNLIKEYAVKRRQAVESNNSAQTSQNTSSSQSGSDDGIQYYGELNINYAPKTAKYYVRHLLQQIDNKNEFKEAANLGIGKVIIPKHRVKDPVTKKYEYKDGDPIHVTEVTGTVGSDVSAIALYIPGYEPEHNLISSPLSDSDSESDKLILNLRYYRKAYDVTYDTDGGTDVTAQKVYYQQLVPPVKDPTKRGYTFKGWSVVDPSKKSDPLYADNTIVSLGDYKMPDHNVQFRANWEANNTTSYRVNVWVQKADLVDKEHPDSLKNYDFVGLVERKNVKTDSEVALNNMDDAGVAKDTSKLNGASVDDYVEDPELGLTREELQGKNADHKDGLIAKFNWMNETPVTSLEGYDTEHPGDSKNNGKDLFTRYFHVNKKLTKRFTKDTNNTSNKLSANDLDNTFDLVYDRKEYELIFAKPAVLKSSEDAERLNNAAIKRKDKDGKTTIYCYAGGGNCSEKYDEVNEYEDNNTINHKGYRVNVRYGQSLTDIWPNVNELDFNDDTGSLGWRIGYAGGIEFRDTPPFRFTKKEFADPKFRVVGNNHKLKISDNPDSDPNNTYELKDNQRLITADTSNTQVMPIQVIIEKQSIASAKKHKKGDTISDDDYVLSTDSYSKDDTSSTEYPHKSSFIAGFNSVDKEKRIETHESDDFDDTLLSDLYSHSIEYKKNGEKDWDDLDDDVKEAFKKEYNVGFRNHLAGGGEDSQEYEENGYLVFKYNRQSYDVQFYNADGNAIKDGDVAAIESLPFEYSLTKRGKKDLKGEDKELYGKDTSYDASVTKDDANDTSKKLDGKYTFTLNGINYSIIRPDYLPKDYVFKGWALDQAGTRFINGEDKDITVPVNGIKLYAAWGLPTNIQHTVTLDYQMHEIGEDGKEGPNVIKTFMCNHNDPIHENDIKIPVRKGFDFYGWELVKKGNEVVEANTPYAFGNKVVEDITLRAVWVQDTRYNGTFTHIFLKPGYTFADYNNAADDTAKKAMVDHVSTQTVSGLREHLRYNAEAVYSDETHFPDKHFTSFEASSDETDNTGEFVYQTYNTRKYRVRYVTIENGKEKDLLPESEVSSVNRKYDVAFYKPIEGFMPRTTQQKVLYRIGKDGKQIGEDTFKFVYDDVRVLKRQDDAQHRPDHYTRYVFKVADNQSSMGSVVDWQGNNVADGSALVYDAIKGTKAYQMPLPTVEAKPGFEFDEWTSKIGSSAPGSTELQYSTGVNRLPIRSEEQNSPEVIYIAKFKLKAPVAAAPQVLTPLENISTESGESAKKLITNADEYPEGATFSFADGATFDSTPGLHKIKVQVKLEGNTAEAEVLYRVLPDLVYKSDWDKFKTSDYGSKHEQEYAPITFTGKNDEGTIIGHDTTGTTPSTDVTTTLTAYVYKGKQVRIRVPQAFGKDHSENNYHYVFKGWATKVVQPTPAEPKPEQKYDIDSEGRYKDVKVDDNSGKTYTAVYKRIDYFSSSSDGGEVPKDAVVAIFKPAPGRLWKDGTSGPKVFYVKKGTDISNIPYSSSDSTNALVRLKENLTNATGTWKRSSMLNDGKKLAEVKDVADVTGEWKDGWKVNESFQEFVADQKDWTEPAVQTDYLVAVQDDADSLPKLTDFITNMPELKAEAALKDGVEDIKVEYDLPTEAEKNKFKQKMLKKPALYTVPLKVTIKYNDAADYKTYKLVGRLKVLYKLMYPDSLPKENTQGTDQTGANAERKLVFDKTKYVEVKFINAKSDTESPNGKGEFAEGSRTLYYAYKDSASGVRAPQVIGKDYDAKGYHYEFQGWEIQEDTTFVTNTATSVPVMTLFAAMTPSTTTVPNPQKVKLYSSAEIASRKFARNTNIVPHYKLVKNVIDASTQEEIPDGYVATIFLPGFGRTWADGSYKPKLLYIRHGKDKEDNIKFAQKVASDTAAKLSGFTKWQMYNARGDKSNILLHDNWNISKPRIFVAEQNSVDDVKIPETVIGVGESITNVNKLVHNTDPKVSVSIDDSSTVDVSKPGISTIMVNVTKPTDEIDKTTGKQKTVTTKLPVRVYVLPKVIANNDLPAKGTAAAKFIEKNYTKVTYVAGDGGSLQKSPLGNAGNKPVSVYWVRNNANGFQMPIPDVLADNGYVFKNWTSITTETPADPADQRKATEEEREALARMAKIDGMHYVAKLISDSRNSTLAALQNMLNEARKSRAEQEAYNVYNAKREELAQVAERKGNTDLASEIRGSHDSLQKIKDQLVKNGIDVDEVIEQLHEKALFAKIAKEAGKSWLAKQISNSKRSSIEALKNLMREAGIDIAEYNKITFDKKKEALAQVADINGLHYVASIIRASHESSLEAFKNLIKSANPDVKIPDFTANEEDYASEEQRELLIQIAEENDKPDIAAKIRLLRSSTLQDLKKLFKDAGVDLYAIPAAKPKHETTITANFELMKTMNFTFRSSAVSGVPATFTLANLTDNSSGNTIVRVDRNDFVINKLNPITNGSNGLTPSCNGTTCTISGTPKIVDGTPKVEVTFTTIDQYGRKANITVYIDIVNSSEQTYIPDTNTQTTVVETSVKQQKQQKQQEVESKDQLASTGSDVYSVLNIASLSSILVALGFAVNISRHRRKDLK
ncbi:repeat protein [Gardnerella vaginalis]|uniref:Repeat protein n=1 Tax=Gardnerella vaginalis TaxID=2702 RepID=A0A135Z829_GARVA|nr:InlB B-repeat-containing protein [Gardnerella vaginalis]KXI17792.1 repeat protein [Gardnerella vaginalis]